MGKGVRKSFLSPTEENKNEFDFLPKRKSLLTPEDIISESRRLSISVTKPDVDHDEDTVLKSPSVGASAGRLIVNRHNSSGPKLTIAPNFFSKLFLF